MPHPLPLFRPWVTPPDHGQDARATHDRCNGDHKEKENLHLTAEHAQCLECRRVWCLEHLAGYHDETDVPQCPACAGPCAWLEDKTAPA